MSNERITAMPRADDAERAVLGSILLDDSKAHSLDLSPSDFYDSRHRTIFKHILEMAESGEAVDLVTLMERLKQVNEIEKAGGPAYLASLTDGLPRAANIAHYARICRSKAALRKLAHLSSEAMQRSLAGEETPEEIAAGLEADLDKIAVLAEPGLRSMSDVLPGVINHLEAARNRNMSGVATGLVDVDALLCGLQPSSLTVVAARPGQGKTSLCLGVAAHAALRLRKTVLLFTLETSMLELGGHILCSQGEVDYHRVRTGYANKEDWRRIVETASNLSESALYCDDTAGLDIFRLSSRSRAFAAKRKADLIIVDYLQLVGAAKKHDTRQGEVAEVSRSLKILAKQLDAAVLAASQLNRRIELRGAVRRPQLSDLRESGSIEQDADAVLFIHRDDEENQSEIMIGKNRHGPTGSAVVGWLPEKRKFVNAWREDEKPTDKWWER